MMAGGRFFATHYALTNEYRQGGFARVYKALDIRDQTMVAIKVLHAGRPIDDRLVNLMFDRETRSLVRLQHPNIVVLKDGGRDPESNAPYFVLEWLERDLASVLKQAPPEGWDSFAEDYALPILDGLACAHANNIVHRDIKPSNILLTQAGVPKISDFGVAKLKTDLQPGLTVADFQTRPFAPKEFDDGQFSYSRDVFAFGVLVLTALAQIDPFSERYASDPYLAIADALGGIDAPDEIIEFLQRCVSDVPEERPINAMVALADLAKIQRKRAANWVKPRRYYLQIPSQARQSIRNLLNLPDIASDVYKAVEEDLDGEVGIAPWRSDTGNEPEGHFSLRGAQLDLHVAVHREGGDRFFVFTAYPLPPSLLERLRERSYRALMQFKVGEPPDFAAAQQAILDLQADVAKFCVEQRAREREDERRRLFNVWTNLLQAKTDLERGRENPIRYEAIDLLGNDVVFTLAQAAPLGILSQARQTELRNGGYLGGDIVDVRGNRITLSVRYGDARRLSSIGVLRVDTWPARAALQRQEEALDILANDRALRKDLGALLISPERARPPEPTETVTFFHPELDDPKKAAVAAGLGTPDFLVVHGPPGTGKTTFIAELVLQYLKENPASRILVTSQTHAALDNALQSISRLDPALKLVRIARSSDPRVAADVGQFLLPAQIAQWRAEVVKEGRQYLRSWARQQGISERDVEIASLFEELASIIATIADLASQEQALTQELRALSQESSESTRTDRGTGLELQLTEIAQQLKTQTIRRDEILGALRRMRAISGPREVEGLGTEELRRRASELVDRQHPAYAPCVSLLKFLADWHARFGYGDEFSVAAVLRSQVVAATCIGLHGFKGANTIEFDVCIVDEASKATVTEVLVPMVQARRWILVGDPRQLPPFVEDALRDVDLLKEYDLTTADVRETIFDRLINRLPAVSQTVLSTQHRMVPQIGDLISVCFYDGQLASVANDGLAWLWPALGNKPVVWYTTSDRPDRTEISDGTSWANQLESRAIRVLLRRINFCAQAGRTRLLTAVVSGYAAQRDLIKREIAAESHTWTSLQLECSTVDAFQGREADIAIYSVTRSNARRELGHLGELPRLNVALSRGRYFLILIGDHRFARTAGGDSNPFRRVIEYIERHPDSCRITAVEL